MFIKHGSSSHCCQRPAEPSNAAHINHGLLAPARAVHCGATQAAQQTCPAQILSSPVGHRPQPHNCHCLPWPNALHCLQHHPQCLQRLSRRETHHARLQACCSQRVGQQDARHASGGQDEERAPKWEAQGQQPLKGRASDWAGAWGMGQECGAVGERGRSGNVWPEAWVPAGPGVRGFCGRCWPAAAPPAIASLRMNGRPHGC
jgi:hypothetical protein